MRRGVEAALSIHLGLVPNEYHHILNEPSSRAVKKYSAVGSTSGRGILQRHHLCVWEGRGMVVAFRTVEGDAALEF